MRDASQVSNAFRLLGSGERGIKVGLNADQEKTSQMPFGFWVLGNKQLTTRFASSICCLKCLSAFGFWGTPSKKMKKHLYHCVSNAFRLLGSGEPKGFAQRILKALWVSNAFRLLGSGERITELEAQGYKVTSLKCLSAFGFWGTLRAKSGSMIKISGLKCLSAFGFWGTRTRIVSVVCVRACLKCLSAFGFWGTRGSPLSSQVCNRVSNAFRILGSGERKSDSRHVFLHTGRSQMPFGFWVLGNS